MLRREVLKIVTIYLFVYFLHYMSVSRLIFEIRVSGNLFVRERLLFLCVLNKFGRDLGSLSVEALFGYVLD